MSISPATRFLRRISAIRIRRESLTVTEHAKKYRVVVNSEHEGRYTDERDPWQAEIQDSVGSGDYRNVTFWKPSQVGGTEIATNVLFYFTRLDGQTVMWCFAGEKPKKKFAKRIRKEVHATPEWRAELQGHGDGISNEGIDFRGAQVLWAMATASGDLRETPARVTIADEIEIFPHNLKGEGSPLELLKARSRTFRRAVQFVLSTCKLPGGPIIECYGESDRREWHVPCLKCGHRSEMSFANVKWPEIPDGTSHETWSLRVKNGAVPVWYECPRPDCRHHHESEGDRAKMNRRGKWVVTRPDVKDHAGFRIESLASSAPSVSFRALAAKFLEARSEQLKGDDGKMQTFYNHERALPFQPRQVHIEETSIVSRVNMDLPRGVVPAWADFWTEGMDTQPDRMIWLRSAWRKEDQRRHVFDWGEIEGEIDDPEFRKVVFVHLSELLVWQGGAKEGRSRAKCVDSADGNTNQAVYALCNMFKGGHCIPVHGGNVPAGRLWTHNAKIEEPHKGLLRKLDVDRIKDWWSNVMRRSGEHSPSFCAAVIHDPVFQRQLCSQMRNAKGHWVKRPEYPEGHWKDADTYDIGAGMLCGILKPAEGAGRPGPKKPRVISHGNADPFGRRA